MATILITGAAGFIGSHLAAAHLSRGDEVIGIDNFATGSRRNLAAISSENLHFHEGDVLDPNLALPASVDFIYHMASPASPPKYLALATETMDVNTIGTKRLIEHAAETGARMLFASTSEVYGDPLVHPQAESYWGNVNPIGPRSIYDEAKRFGETLMSFAHRSGAANTVLIRIFNTYGPHMDPYDGRVVSTFIRQTLQGTPLTMFGSGTQTRSFCYVDDLVRGIMATMDSSIAGPVNLGNPTEFTLLELAEVVADVLGSTLPIEFSELPVDDPQQRRPDISYAEAALGWQPTIALAEGVARTADWMRGIL